ncbi:uncharacterized protein LOC144440654 [Glandiceps talaboti]
MEYKSTLYSLFTDKCKECGDSTCLISTENVMTYAEVKDAVNKLAADITQVLNMHFYNMDIAGSLVGLHMESGFAYVISVLAVLKLGLGFLPLPTNYPTERTGFILNDAKPLMVICSQHVVFEDYNMADQCNPSLHVYVQKLFVNLRASKCERDTLALACKGMCYVMYTSGSTGLPKGVRIMQGGVVNMITAQIEAWHLDQSHTICQFASIGFDATISEIFTALLSGGRLVLLQEEERLGLEFVKSMNALEVTTITLPPTLLSTYNPEDFPLLQNIVCAGEACPRQVAGIWSRPNCRFYNAYGPTEATVCTTIYHHQNTGHGEGLFIPIGQPIRNVECLILDVKHKPVLTNEVGEIFIGGPGVANGYIGHAASRTEEHFVKLEKSDGMQYTYYKTGDIATKDLDGMLYFLGRGDRQVQVHGQRVELDEIEAELLRVDGVEMAVVVLHKCLDGNSSLRAFVSPCGLDFNEIKTSLKNKLPKCMIPSTINSIEATQFRRSFSDKIDRNSMAELSCYRCSKDETHFIDKSDPGRSECEVHMEQTLVGIWRKVLGLPPHRKITRKSSFQDLGGNSLRYVFLQREIKENLQIEIPFNHLFKHTTLEGMESLIHQLRRNGISATKGKLETTDMDETLSHLIEDARFREDEETRLKENVSLLPQTSTLDSVLLTGASGFLGSFLLMEILETSKAVVFCLVRTLSESTGLTKIKEALLKYGLWKDAYRQRIRVIVGDLSKPWLGIQDSQLYDILCRDINLVIANGAYVNYNQSYKEHRNVNVNSVKEIIKLASTYRVKTMVYISSLSVFLFPSKGPLTATEEMSLGSADTIIGGYGKSKWVADSVMQQALKYLPGAIIRPGRVTGRSTDGAGPNNDLFVATLMGMINLGAYPDISFPYDLVPVDYVSKASLGIAMYVHTNRQDSPNVYHIFNHQTIDFQDLFRGYGLKALHLDDWRKLLKGSCDRNNPLLPLTPFYLSEFWNMVDRWPCFDTTHTNSVVTPEVRKLLLPAYVLLPIYLKYLQIKEE